MRGVLRRPRACAALALALLSLVPPPPTRAADAEAVPLHAADSRWPHPLRLLPPPPGAMPRSAFGDGWRHDFEFALTADGARRVVHEPDGRRHVFEPSVPRARADGPRYRARDPLSGELRDLGDGLHLWRRADTLRVRFYGSLPVRVERAPETVFALRYEQDALVAVRETTRGATLRFFNAAGRLRAIGLPGGEWLHLERGPQGSGTPRLRRERHAPRSQEGRRAPLSDGYLQRARAAGEMPCRADEAAPERCDGEAYPPEATFRRGAGLPRALRVDARPASCRSYFVDYAGTARGAAIENGLDGLAHYAGYTPTVRSFPIVDFVGAEWRVVRSRDLADPSYAAPEALYRRLLRDALAIERGLRAPLAREGVLTLTELGRTTTLRARDARPVVLELVVRHGLATPDHARQIARARRALRERHAILLRVLEIP